MAKQSQLTFFESKIIAFTRYYFNTGILHVKFNNGKIYEYFDVTLACYIQLIAAESIGSAFHKVIKANYEGDLIADIKPIDG